MNAPQGDVRAPSDADLEARLAATLAELEELRESHQRLAADLDNHRRRCRGQAERAIVRERGTLLREFLEVVDDLDRAVGASPDASEADLRAGLDSVVSEARHLLSRHGVKRMDSIGKTFDPERHEAVGLAEGGEGLIHAEVRPGYLLDGDVLRPAEVLVGKSESR